MSQPTSTAAPAPTDADFRLGAGIDFSDPNSPLAPYYLRGSHVAATIILAIVFLIITRVPVWHTDVWGHMAHGRAIVSQRQLPTDDPLSRYSEPGVPTMHYSWLTQVGFYAVHSAGESLAGGDEARRAGGGAEALRLAHALAVTLRLFLLMVAFRRLTGSLPAAVAGMGFVVVVSFGNLAVVRPQVVGELLFAMLLVAVSRPIMSRRAVLAIPALLAVWANAHASFAVGLMLLAVIGAGKTIQSAWDHRGSWRAVMADPSVIRPLAALVIGVGLIASANPWGPRIFLNVVEMSAHPVVRAMDEWQPIRFDSGGGRFAYAATVAFVGAGWLLGRRLTPAGILLTLVFASQPLIHQRTFIWWLMLAPWVALPAWTAALSRFAAQPVPSFRKTLLVAALAFLALAWSAPARWALAGSPAAPSVALSPGTPWSITQALRQDVEPDAALADILKSHYPDQRFTGTIFASETLGDYLLWRLPADYPVFAYSHVHLMSSEHWGRIMTIRRADAGWQHLLNENRVNLIIVEVEQNGRLCELLRRDAGWNVIVDEVGSPTKRDPRCRLFVAVRTPPL